MLSASIDGRVKGRKGFKSMSMSSSSSARHQHPVRIPADFPHKYAPLFEILVHRLFHHRIRVGFIVPTHNKFRHTPHLGARVVPQSVVEFASIGNQRDAASPIERQRL